MINRYFLVLLSFAVSLCAASADDKSVPKRPNVLFIAVDDLNHWVGYTGRNPQTKTPNIDRLSRMGVSFMRADCPAPLCNPSRAALMSGLRPSTSGVYQNGDQWKDQIPPGLGLSATFQKAGYFVAGAGKIYHGNSYHPDDWDDYFVKKGEGHGPKQVRKMDGFHNPMPHDLKDTDLNDWHTTDYCIKQLERKHDKPFFLACGLQKPHLPWAVPRKYYDLFPLDEIKLPPHKQGDLEDIPKAGVQMAEAMGDHKKILKSGRWKAAIQSYLATIAYTDMNIGRLLDALEKSPHRENTIIMLWGDHGWHLGEKEHWRKFTLWEEGVRAPFIVAAPGITKPNVLCERPVDFMSIYPTLCDLAGIPRPKHVEGVSIKPLLINPGAEWKTPALCTYGYKNHTVRTEQWRYIRYADGSEELYDHTRDPYEWANLAGDSKTKSTRTELAKWFPKKNAPERGKKTGE